MTKEVRLEKLKELIIDQSNLENVLLILKGMLDSSEDIKISCGDSTVTLLQESGRKEESLSSVIFTLSDNLKRINKEIEFVAFSEEDSLRADRNRIIEDRTLSIDKGWFGGAY